VILVDSSVWIDFFRNRATAEAEWLDRHLGTAGILVGDLILAEVLRGFREERGFNEARRLLGQFDQVVIGGTDLAVQAARHFRKLRGLGVTVRGTVDVIIASRCLSDGLQLLHNDRDFDPFETHLGLDVVRCQT
jgi:predicted nucleic acid-binding protein